ncbi:MAG TPA: PAS domain S-box protein, partial [Spirochaetia bacterium]|nr:PAS domain S-box protein [Spirochaetia bacterium]
MSTRWTIALSFLFYLLGSLALTLFVSPTGISGLLFLFPLYAVTWFWGKRTGLVAAPLGVGMNIAIWLAAGDGMQALYRFGAVSIVVLYGVAALGHVVFVLVVSTLRRKEEQNRSEIQRSTELLRLSESKYRSLVEVAPEGVWVVENGKVIFCNTHFLDILGYSREEMMGMPVETINFRDDLQNSMERYTARAEGRLLPKSVTRQVRKNGKVIWVETSGQRIEWEGKSAVLYFSSDVSERKAFEEQFAQAQKMEAIGRLSGGIAHDFNNILQVILGFCTMMKSYPDDRNAILNDLAIIEDSAKRAASLTQQLLAFSRKQVVQPKVIDLGRLVQQSEKMLCRVLGEDVALTVVLGGEEACVRADAAQIQQVTMNLALNARDAMPNGGRITISIENVHVREAAGRDIPPGDYVRLTVNDTGRGMDSHTLGHL